MKDAELKKVLEPKLYRLYAKLQRLEDDEKDLSDNVREEVRDMSKRFADKGFDIEPQTVLKKNGRACISMNQRRAQVRINLLSYKKSPEYFEKSLLKSFAVLASKKYGIPSNKILHSVDPPKEAEYPKIFKRFTYACNCHRKTIPAKHHNRIVRKTLRLHCDRCDEDMHFVKAEEITPKFIAIEDDFILSSVKVVENTLKHKVKVSNWIQSSKELVSNLKCKPEDIVFI